MDTTSFTGELLEQQASLSGGRSRTLSREAHSEAEHVVLSHNYDSSSFLSDEALPSERARNNIERQQLRERGSYSNSHRGGLSTEYTYTTFAHVSPNSPGEHLGCVATWLPLAPRDYIDSYSYVQYVACCPYVAVFVKYTDRYQEVR